MKKNILFLCTGNSCRSQMAEGWGKNLKSENFQFYSAGTKKHIIHVGFDDPPRLTHGMSDEEKILNVYRRVRDEIQEMVKNIESYMGSLHEW